MKPSTLSVKRRPVSKGGFRKLFVNARRQQRAVAAAPLPEVEGDVPNLGIARALVVILIIHVIAVGGIFAHSKFVEKGDDVLASATPDIEPARQPRDAGERLPQIRETDSSYLPKAGDTYASIAAHYGVSEQALREENGNYEIRPSRILRIPARSSQQIVGIDPLAAAAISQGNPVMEGADAMPDEESAPPPIAVDMDEMRSAPMVPTQAGTAGTVVKPRVVMDSAAVASNEAAPAPSPASPAPTAGFNRSYTVKPGDTFWKISQQHKTSPEAVMKANGISDPRKLKPGMKLRVP